MAANELVAEWNTLTKRDMPALARERDWPVHLDHCFQRILLDHAVGGYWKETIASPAYRHATDAQLGKAIALGQDAIAGTADMDALNRQSLKWRGKL
ncbi:MAG: GCN5-related N-acetyltransferase [Pontixanthobacter sp.]